MNFKKGDRVVYTAQNWDNSWDKYIGIPSTVDRVHGTGTMTTTFDEPIDESYGLYAKIVNFVPESVYNSKLYKAMK